MNENTAKPVAPETSNDAPYEFGTSGFGSAFGVTKNDASTNQQPTQDEE
ncbi:hypothetical protein [Paraburkholderia jirisanensis]